MATKKVVKPKMGPGARFKAMAKKAVGMKKYGAAKGRKK